MYRTGGVAARQTGNQWFQARPRQSRPTHPLLRYANFLDHLSELDTSYDSDTVVLDGDDSDEELVITGSRAVTEPQIRRVVDINQVRRVARSALRLEPGCEVELEDQSFIRILEYLPDTEEGECIRGYRLLLQNHPSLLMVEREHEVVQLLKMDEKMDVEYATSTVRVDQVVRNCTVIYTNRHHMDLQYRKHVRAYTGDECDEAIYFCRWASADCNIRTDERAPNQPPVCGSIQHLRANQADNGALTTPDGPIEFQVPDSELRRQWRGVERSKSRRYTFGDAFCGAGGTTAGAFASGLKLVFGVDFDERAIQTYRRNFGLSGTDIMQRDITDFINIASRLPGRYMVDILHMSPPCQPFCGANRNPNMEKNKRNIDAFSKVPSLLEVCKPRIVTLEEARSLTDIDKREHFRKLISWFVRKGYSVQWKVVDLSKYGVPQTRHRTIIIASGPGEKLPAFIQPTHGTEPGLLPPPTVNGALSTIPDYARHQNEIPEMRTAKASYNGDGLCQTIMTAVKPHHFHPNGLRRFSIREYATLQTFPLWFIFRGTIAEMLRQIGNAVPPLFAETMFVHLKAALTAADEAEDREE